MRVSVIIPAAGLGCRFQESLCPAEKKNSLRSKLFYELGGEPVLLKTIRAFEGIPQIREMIIAISPEVRAQAKAWEHQVKGLKVRWILGGKTRAESVWKALKKTSSRSDWVMVHDGARPMITSSAIRKVLRASKGWEGVILARKVVPTIKKVVSGDGHICETLDRNLLYEAETPQLARRDVLLKAYRLNPKAFQMTDEAGLLEALGARVRVTTHTDWNPKLTLATDLKLAQAMAQKSTPPEVRVGLGFDIHRLVPGRKFYLGGVVIPSPKGSLGHSDGDALLHAIADAMLGAIGAGDIGEWFSDRDPKNKNIRSTKILATILEEALRQGWKPYHVDTNVILEAPKLFAYKGLIRKSIAKCLALSEKDISVKARTHEKLGPIGEGEAILCQAVVSMRKVS